MAKSAIPGPLERRHLVESDLSEERARTIGEAYLAEDRLVEAVDFLARAGAGDRLAELHERAIESGDAFLLRSVVSASDLPAEREHWRRLADAANRLGKERYALDAQRQAEREGE